jgi:hypothetical protein
MSRTLTETCYCQFHEHVTCGDCNTAQFPLNEDDEENACNALTHFVDTYPKAGAERTIKEAARLNRKLRAMLKFYNEEKTNDAKEEARRKKSLKLLYSKSCTRNLKKI